LHPPYASQSLIIEHTCANVFERRISETFKGNR
jgi:hypothetical protein